MPSIALATAIPALALDDDLAPLVAAFARAGVETTAVAWDDPTVSWRRFDAVLLRSTWDYMDRLDAFLRWCDSLAGHTRLFNTPDVVRWNTDKRYLLDLARAGAPVIETHVLESPADLGAMPDLAEFVVKPAVGAGSRGARRFLRSEHDAARAHAQGLLARGPAVIVQPYLGQVDEHGETALLFFDGEFSHAIRKAPLLQRGADSTRAPFSPERITRRVPMDAEIDIGRQVLTALPFAQPLYARVDLLPSPEGPLLLELELTEPSLFLEHGDSAASLLVEALLNRLAI